ncbi:hypothetical protein GGR53DRAFT_402681 [Hypoxylon sp. FL1150]|nr:hypothetical protein GGR53DRAFT_402681 [Hypoxylon sp. FL1150]
MFQRLSNFRRKDRDEGRLSRFNRTAGTPESKSSNSSPSSVSRTIQEDQVEPIAGSPLFRSTAGKSHAQSRRNSETEAGSIGLTVIYTPENAHKADIVFIHGLGGTSRWTWSKDRDPELFWPLTFLPLEPDVCLARILTFGYNANFRKSGNVSTSVLDFAKDLLFDLKYAKDDKKEDLNMGVVPLIFVVHSMGGLIVKEAYMQGQNDPEYEAIIKAISAITFLATPHRGTHLAETLNRILQWTMITNLKQYISELAKNSFTLQKLNEQFRHIAPRLDIVSFYETQPTSITLKNARIMVLEKDSSVLGYPGETSKALDADHHGVCKYESPRDPNYITVRNVLKSLLSKIISTSNPKRPTPSNRRESHDLKSLLVITELPTTDYSFFRDQWAHGTCEWILQNENFLQWLQAPDLTPRFLFLNGGPATGKSVLSSYIINNLVEQGAYCHYFFIRFGDEKKRNLGTLLRSIAYQMVLALPNFLHKLLELTDEAIDYETADPRTIWNRIFKSILFDLTDTKPVYWIIDGIDEAHDPRAVIKLLSDVSTSSIPLRILIVGRKTSQIEAAFQKVPDTLKPGLINIEGHLEDLRRYVSQELNMSGSSDFKEDIVKRVVEGSQNNFLWVRLAVDKLNSCHRLADVELALQELPIGMEALYDRMASSIARNPSPTDRELASNIMECVACSFRHLTVAELSQALHEDMSGLLDLERSIVDLCGGFVTVDNSGNVTMIHQTAREYLLSGQKHPFHIDFSNAHERMFLSCMKCLMILGLRAKVDRNQKPELVDYASGWWSSHLVATSVGRGQVSEILKQFLTSHWVLAWIHILAAGNKQRVLIQTSKDLSKYCLKRQRLVDSQPDPALGQQIVEQELLESWSTDFVKLVGKFGANLRQNPESIYKLIPPFCPKNSSIHQLFGKAEAKSISVSGSSTENWDDSLARISLGFSSYASSIIASGALVAILASAGSVFVYDSSTFEEATISPIKHGERVYRMELNSTGTLLATYGYRTTKVWEVSTGNCKVSVDNIKSRPRPLSMLFINNNSSLLVSADDRRVRSLDLDQQFPPWQHVAELEEPELEGHFLNAASHMALNKDGTLVAIAYRGHPLSAWELEGPMHIGHCWRKREEVSRGEVIDAAWHPHYPEVLGLYIEGVLFKWCPYEDEVVEVTTGASRLAISRDGNLLATGDAHGTVKVYTTSDLGLLYQLTSPDTVLGIAFSPDNQRFYDIRGYYGNAWEPNALMKFAEPTNKNEGMSETESLARSLSTYSNTYRRIDSITVLAVSPAGRLYSYGTETGAVRLLDLREETPIDIHKSRGFLSIEQMSWSSDGRYMCFSDASKRIFIFAIAQIEGTSKVSVEIVAEISMKGVAKGSITQLLFHPRSSHLLASTSNTIHSISLTSTSIEQSVELDTADHKWIAHPKDPDMFVGFGLGKVRVLDWNLVEIHTYSTALEGSLDHAVVDNVLPAHDKEHVSIQISSRTHNVKERTLYYFNTQDFSISRDTSEAPIIPATLPRDVSSEVALSLTFLSHDRLIFLSRGFSICSWQLPSSSISSKTGKGVVMANPTFPHDHLQPDAKVRKPYKELFSLPGDWISRDCLSICSIWGAEKSFLCPRNGEVVVVKCAALV